MRSMIIALVLLGSFPSWAHPESQDFDLDSYNGNFALVNMNANCMLKLLISGTHLVTTVVPKPSDDKCSDKYIGIVRLFECNEETGICRNQEDRSIRIILLEGGDFILDNWKFEGDLLRYSTF